MNKHVLAAFAAATLIVGVSGCKKVEIEADPTAETAEAGSANLSEVIGQVPGLSQSADLVKAAGLLGMLEGDAAYTLFLPSDDALKAIPARELARLRNEEARPELIALLRQHIVPGTVTQTDLETAITDNDGTVNLATVAEKNLSVSKAGEAIRLGSGDNAPSLTGVAAAASNGVVYVIDGLVAPQE